jgi:hypothetical protein
MKALGKGSIASIVRVGLQIAWIVLWAVAGVLALVAIAYAIILALIAGGSIDPTFLTGGEGQIRMGESGDSNFRLSYDNAAGATWPVVVPALLIGGVAVGGSLVIIWRLKKLFDSFSSGEPFARENATHLRVIWITMAIIEVSRYVLMGVTAFLLAQFGEGAREISINIDGDRIAAWGSILILIVLAEVFREGARMKEEQELTI